MKPNKTQPQISGDPAFTLIELMVVLAVIGLLAMTVLAGTSGDVSKRLACADNLRRLGFATQSWAQDNGGRFPNDGHSSPYITTQTFRNVLTNNYKLERKVFYCPSNPEWNTDSFWNSSGGTSVLSYSYFTGFPNYNDPALVSSYYPGNAALPGGDNLRAHLPIFATNTTDQAYYPIVWADSNRKYFGWAGGSGVLPRSANHFGSAQPLGANENYLDGHVEWADTQQVVSRVRMYFSSGVEIYFSAGKP